MGEEPVASRPDLPEGYGIPRSRKGLLDWAPIRRRLEESTIYWLATADPAGRPHAVPVWGAWLNDKLYFDGGPSTRHMRNAAANPGIVVHLEDGSDVVIVEGVAEAASVPDPELTARVAEGYRAKYATKGYSPKADAWDGGGLWVVHPRRAFAWKAFPTDATRFSF
jgi:nitroimidazol reductase NimA-like FMN-containing flavoprotein (pyridoxamine 5'-phosphate oxidase superfamily)